MTWRFKLVASALVVILLAMPLSALGSCWWQMRAVEHCTPHCPMMSAHVPSVTIQEALANSSCCRVCLAKILLVQEINRLAERPQAAICYAHGLCFVSG